MREIIDYKNPKYKQKYKDLFHRFVKEEKQIDVERCSHSRQHDLWRRFVKRWNDGKMRQQWYSLMQTSEAGHNDQSPVGPSKPTVDDLYDRQELREQIREQQQSSKRYETKLRVRRETELLDEVLPKEPAGSKQALLQKKKEKQHTLKQYRERSDEEMELNENDLFGEPDSFTKQVEREHLRKKKRDEGRQMRHSQKDAEILQKIQERKEKEKKTVEMLREMAQSRFTKSS
ncbi:fungal protein [Schizosaccharomyces cryophilus OY26]|uniref:Fungal protein n=1 Tax=Schizosaccharomyces cryophilus (strain OY26 / ATCC MYA-4695 / CBS 11777 / NBRC 106824 / NRRL Y48691) TaxID=653667 RepID=S9XEC1_SCHCR|nr:uncharacterized protein SPOG_04783 [Schizosaccharomyces cryophilus OY26]EPY52126.1 fungal protein [Schizosaccharomyces cryophilus OY26]